MTAFILSKVKGTLTVNPRHYIILWVTDKNLLSRQTLNCLYTVRMSWKYSIFNCFSSYPLLFTHFNVLFARNNVCNNHASTNFVSPWAQVAFSGDNDKNYATRLRHFRSKPSCFFSTSTSATSVILYVQNALSYVSPDANQRSINFSFISARLDGFDFDINILIDFVVKLFVCFSI